jgi:hypothetical protein
MGNTSGDKARRETGNLGNKGRKNMDKPKICINIVFYPPPHKFYSDSAKRPILGWKVNLLW